MNLLNSVKEFVKQVKIEREVAVKRRVAKLSGLGFPNQHIANTNDGGYPVFLADDFVFVHTRIKDAPNALAVSLPNGIKEIYINNKFLELDPIYQEAIIQHEVGHLVLGAIYTPMQRHLNILGLSNKAYLCECTADDYAVAGGHKMKETLIHLRDHWGLCTKEVQRRIARLSK